MKGPFKTLEEARAEALPGEVIMVRNTLYAASPAGAWAVMTDEEATRAYNTPLNPFEVIWETIKCENTHLHEKA